jgi:DNA-binding IscR family transcriptional regulator
VLCSHEVDAGQTCATKLLWTRVHGGVTKALTSTTLADLVEFAGPPPTSEPVAAPVA